MLVMIAKGVWVNPSDVIRVQEFTSMDGCGTFFVNDEEKDSSYNKHTRSYNQTIVTLTDDSPNIFFYGLKVNEIAETLNGVHSK